MFIVFRCSCGRHLYAPENAKTRSCPCGKRVTLSKVKVLARVGDPASAADAVRRLQLGDKGMTGFKPAG